MGRMHIIGRLVELFGGNSPTIVEIGVHHADTTCYLLDKYQNIKHLYAIDPYINRDDAYQRVKDTLDKYKNCTLIREKSQNKFITKSIPSEVDLVFIDGSHSEKDVYADLELYVPKVRSGGIISGHDWCGYKMGVVLAGTEYFSKYDSLFQPLFTNEELKDMNITCVQAGLSIDEKNLNARVVHKDYTSGWPVWWRVKK